MAERHLAPRQLSLAGVAAQLRHRFHDKEHAVHARMDAGEPAAVGVDGEAATRRDRAIPHEASAFALGAEA